MKIKAMAFLLLLSASVSYANGTRQIEYGSICGVGRDKGEAQGAAMALMGSKRYQVRVNYSSITGWDITNEYMLGPFTKMGDFEYQSLGFAKFNTIACMPVKGQSLSANELKKHEQRLQTQREENYFTCHVSKILFRGLINPDEKLLVKNDYSEVVLRGITTSCDKAPAHVARKAKASYVLGCGEGEDRDVFEVSLDGTTIKLGELAEFTCETPEEE